MAQRLVKGLHSVDEHRGGCLSRLGAKLFLALQGQGQGQAQEESRGRPEGQAQADQDALNEDTKERDAEQARRTEEPETKTCEQTRTERDAEQACRTEEPETPADSGEDDREDDEETAMAASVAPEPLRSRGGLGSFGGSGKGCGDAQQKVKDIIKSYAARVDELASLEEDCGEAQQKVNDLTKSIVTKRNEMASLEEECMEAMLKAEGESVAPEGWGSGVGHKTQQSPRGSQQ